MPVTPNNSIIPFIFFGNYFYGFCTIGLSIEASLQQRTPLPAWLFYVLIFTATVFYYTKAYVTESTAATSNVRTLWYIRNRRLVKRSQVLMIGVFAMGVIWVTVAYWQQIWHMPWLHWALLFVFPAVAGLYYGIDTRLIGNYNLRQVGWLKPFVIGFTWAGMVTIYPILFYKLSKGESYEPSLISTFLFIKNFMFVTVLCIMFDIKDYAMDYNQQLKTFVVNTGLRKTIFYIIIPLCALGLGSFWYYGFTHQFSLMKIALNTVPFVLLIIVAYSLHNRRSILYYLTIIDGLMLVKAICGSVAMIYF